MGRHPSAGGWTDRPIGPGDDGVDTESMAVFGQFSTSRPIPPGPRRVGRALSAAALLVSATAAVSSLSASGVGAAGAESATITVVQGIDPSGDGAGAVDVRLDGRICALRNVAVGTVSKGMSVPAGPHTLEVLPADGHCSGGAPLATVVVQTVSGGDYSVIAHVDGSGVSSLEPHQRDLTALAPGTARVAVHNTTAAVVSVSIVPAGSNGAAAFTAAGLNPAQSSTTATIATGAARIDVATTSGVLHIPFVFGADRVVDLYVTGRFGDQYLVVDAQFADSAGAVG